MESRTGPTVGPERFFNLGGGRKTLQIFYTWQYICSGQEQAAEYYNGANPFKTSTLSSLS
ncbi:hypothetical protein E2C01_031601 [Portunus trituberculatus]|uniref:Uncharacterized protein n=1 Tax=Portunus trituberculatus TaxID=210409 RepID=A0A5B7ET71_PORTR|nr:hypothetical protein [Portunus trituberculatus]